MVLVLMVRTAPVPVVAGTTKKEAVVGAEVEVAVVVLEEGVE